MPITLLIIVAFMLSSCATVKTTRVTENQTTGVVYFLPKQRVKLNIKGTPSPTDLQKQIASAKDALVKADEALKTATAEQKGAQALLDKGKLTKNAEAIARLTVDEAIARAKKDIAQDSFDQAQQKLKNLEAAQYPESQPTPFQNKVAAARKAVNDLEMEIKKAENDYDEASEALEKTRKKQPPAPQEIQSAEAILDQKRDAWNAQGKTLADAQKSLQDLEGAAPKLECAKIDYTVTLSLLPLEPDPSHAYIANLSRNVLRDDALKIETTPEGLLTNTEVTAVDRTAEIIIQIAATIASFGVLPVPSPRIGILSKVPQPKDVICPKPVTYEAVIDPADRAQIADKINAELRSVLVPYQISWERPLPKGTAFKSPGGTIDGLLYRRPLPYIFSVSRCTPDCYREQAAIVLVPNEGPIASVPFNASSGVTTVDKVTFTQGMLTKWDTSKPSEIASIIRIPAGVVTTSLSTLTEVLQARFNVNSKEADLVNSEKSLLEAINTLNKTKAAQSGNTGSGSTPTAQ
jgi:hypothetical protein